VSIGAEPTQAEYLWRNILEYNPLTSAQESDFNSTLQKHKNMRAYQANEKAKLKIQDIKSDEHKQVQCKIWLRIAKERGIIVENIIGEEYKGVKEIVT
jgi:hypothetical protein